MDGVAKGGFLIPAEYSLDGLMIRRHPAPDQAIRRGQFVYNINPDILFGGQDFGGIITRWTRADDTNMQEGLILVSHKFSDISYLRAFFAVLNRENSKTSPIIGIFLLSFFNKNFSPHLTQRLKCPTSTPEISTLY